MDVSQSFYQAASTLRQKNLITQSSIRQENEPFLKRSLKTLQELVKR